MPRKWSLRQSTLATKLHADIFMDQAYLEPERIASLTLVSTAAELKSTVVRGLTTFPIYYIDRIGRDISRTFGIGSTYCKPALYVILIISRLLVVQVFRCLSSTYLSLFVCRVSYKC